MSNDQIRRLALVSANRELLWWVLFRLARTIAYSIALGFLLGLVLFWISLQLER